MRHPRVTVVKGVQWRDERRMNKDDLRDWLSSHQVNELLYSLDGGSGPDTVILDQSRSGVWDTSSTRPGAQRSLNPDRGLNSRSALGVSHPSAIDSNISSIDRSTP